MPVLTPGGALGGDGPRSGSPRSSASRTGRDADFILPVTHEETATFHAREIQSYKELPQLWYHFQTKDRDEPRARGGLLRVREFVMKDAYSFDRDEEGFVRSFEANREAYEKIFERCGLQTYYVQAESGIMGRQAQLRLPRALRLGREHARPVRERRLRGGSRGRAGDSVRRAAPGAAERSRGGRDARRHHDRGAGGVSRHRRVGDVEGDAGRQGRRHARARADPRRRPAQRDEAVRRATRRVAARDGRRDPHRLRRRTEARSGRSASRARSSPTRRCAKGSSSRARTGTASTSAASRPAATTSRASPTCASRSRATAAPSAGAA